MSSKFEQIEEKFLDAIFTLYSLDFDEEEGVVLIQLEDAEPLEIPVDEFLDTDPEDLAGRLVNYTADVLEASYEEEGEESEETSEESDEEDRGKGGQQKRL
jgi:hypothetical protein